MNAWQNRCLQEFCADGGAFYSLQIQELKAQERVFVEARNGSSHRITEIRTQLKQMMRMDEKIMEADNKIFSLRSELARVSEKVNLFSLDINCIDCLVL